MKRKLYFVIVYCFLQGCTSKEDMSSNIRNFDETLFPILLTSYMYHHQGVDDIANIQWSTDDVAGKKFEWVRFRSLIGKKENEVADFCIGIDNHAPNITLNLIHIKSGRSCDDSQNEVFAKLSQIKRATFKLPSKENEKLEIDIQWTESEIWKSENLQYPLPHFPFNHKNIVWGKTWKNQIPMKNGVNINPEFFVQSYSVDKNLSFVKFNVISHTESKDWKNAKTCFAVNDQCIPTMTEQCYLCERGSFTLYNTKCPLAGTSYCGEIECGKEGQPACYLGFKHIKQEDFKECGPFTEQWFCQPGLEVQCVQNIAICK